MSDKTENTDVMQDKIDKFDSLPKVAKYMTLSQAEVMHEIHKANSEILKSCYKEGQGLTVECIIGDIAILKRHKDEYYGFCLKTEKGWRQDANVAKSLDAILLIALGVKHDGSNSHFGYYASKMLGMTFV
jgi:hypothetical protein